MKTTYLIKLAAMGYIKPSVNFQGFFTALRDYNEKSIIEELAANSYDAYASTFLMLLDDVSHKLYILDDGNGFEEKSVTEILTLGGSNKLYAPDGDRAFLGKYGFGLKAVIKIADSMEIITCSDEENLQYSTNANLLEFNNKMEVKSKGYTYKTDSLPIPESKGTVIILKLKEAITKTKLDEFAINLGNLPNLNGAFKCYYGYYRPIKQEVLEVQKNFVGLKELATKLYERDSIKLASNLIDSELSDCEEVAEIEDKEDEIKAKIYFAGMQGEKPKSLKESLRGVYIRVDGRLLRQNYATDKYIGGISKLIQFKSGMRTELEINWLRTEMNLSREGINFSNPKLESIFKKALSRIITKFLKPKLIIKEKAKLKSGNEILKGRIELANKRVSKNNKVVINGIQNGFAFKPDSDAELAMLVAQSFVMTKINPAYKLIDYNDKLPFDCMIWDSVRRDFIYTELEPTLMEFLDHNFKDQIQLIITWTLGKWRLGGSNPRKKGKGGFFELISLPHAQKGSYRLNEFASETSVKPRKHYEIIVVEEIL